MDGDTLLARRPSDTGPADALFTSSHQGLRRPILALGREYHPDATAFVLTTAADISALEILDHQGNLRATVLRPGVAMPPLAGSTHLVVPWGDGIQWVSLAAGAIAYTLPIPHAPTTPAAPFGPELLSGGGSHWLVGFDRGLISVADRYLNRRLEDGPIDPQVVADTPRITGLHVVDGTPRALVVLGDRLVVQLQRADTHHLQLFRIDHQVDRTELVPLGSVELPSAPTAAPVGVDCQQADTDPAYCPRFEVATVIVGGEGWLRAYHLATGAHVTLSDEPVTWTGLALGRGGWVAGGGSHWLPADPSPSSGLWLHHPLLGSELLLDHASPENTDRAPCAASPVWDHGGQLALPHDDQLELVELVGALPTLGPDGLLGPLGPASGPVRPDGDNQNSRGMMDAFACGDGTPRDLASLPLDPATVSGLLFHDKRVLAWGRSDDVAFFQWFVLDNGRWHMDPLFIPDASEIAEAAIVDESDFVVAFVDRSGQQLLERYTASQAFLHRTNIGGDNPGLAPRGLVPQGDGVHLVIEFPATVARVKELDGRLDEVDFGDAPQGGSLKLLPPLQGVLGGGAVMVVSDGARLVVRRIDAQLAEQAVAIETGFAAPLLVDATTDRSGRVRVLVEDGPHTHLLHYDANLERLGTRRLPLSASLITAPDGQSLLIRSTGLARLSSDDALGLTQPFPFAVADVPIPVGPTSVGFVVGLPASDPPRLVVATVDPLGQSGCLGAGACVGSRMFACDLVDPCLAVGCEPTTGDCREEPAGICGP
jgi:hypothetical protein